MFYAFNKTCLDNMMVFSVVSKRAWSNVVGTWYEHPLPLWFKCPFFFFTPYSFWWIVRENFGLGRLQQLLLLW